MSFFTKSAKTLHGPCFHSEHDSPPSPHLSLFFRSSPSRLLSMCRDGLPRAVITVQQWELRGRERSGGLDVTARVQKIHFRTIGFCVPLIETRAL